MPTIYKTTVNYPNDRPLDGNPQLTEIWSRLTALSNSYVSGPEILDPDPIAGGYTINRRWSTNEAAQSYVNDVNELMTSYEKTVTITEEVR
jgi:hypothetical protein